MLRRLLLPSGVLATAVSLVALATPPAHAALRPQPDSFTAFAGGVYRVDVLANDRTTWPHGDPSLCGVTVGPNASGHVFAEQEGDLVYLELREGASGVVSFSYEACAGSSRQTAQVTLTIKTLTPLVVTVPRKKRARLAVRNPNAVPVTIVWGSTRNARPDGRRTVRPRTKVNVRVTRTKIFWTAYHLHGQTPVFAGDGVVRGIKRPR